LVAYENPFDVALSGLEIKDWIWHHSHNKTKYNDVAKRMYNFFNLDDDKYYMMKLCNNVPTIIEVPKKGIKYDVPCNDQN